MWLQYVTIINHPPVTIVIGILPSHGWFMALFLPRGPEVDLSQVKWLVPAFGVTKVRWGMAWHRRGRWVFWL